MTTEGMFLGLESLLAALHRQHAVARPLTSFLGELRACLPLNARRLGLRGRPRVAFTPELTERGFYLVDALSSGKAITVSVGWLCPEDRSTPESAPYFPAGTLEFGRWRKQTLTRGKWIEPRPDGLNFLLLNLLRASATRLPVNILSLEGKAIILDSFNEKGIGHLVDD
jgi:hypothetical protein